LTDLDSLAPPKGHEGNAGSGDVLFHQAGGKLELLQRFKFEEQDLSGTFSQSVEVSLQADPCKSFHGFYRLHGFAVAGANL
jgi:hypothetical protein